MEAYTRSLVDHISRSMAGMAGAGWSDFTLDYDKPTPAGFTCCRILGAKGASLKGVKKQHFHPACLLKIKYMLADQPVAFFYLV